MKTDFQVRQDVIGELRWEPSVDSSHIDVEVKDGVVTLAGRVSSHAEKSDAANTVQRISGVRELTVDLHIRPIGSGLRSDADSARTAEDLSQ
jgi:osmotically-inducible protein OsmY